MNKRTVLCRQHFSLRVISLLLCLLGTATSIMADGINKEKVFSLNGAWALTGYSPDKYQTINLPAQVPGQVHVDLLREHKIADPFWRDNADKCQWVEHWDWTYKKYFTLPKDFRGKQLQLQFDGLDTYCDIYLNGRKFFATNGKTTTSNMFVAYRFNVTQCLNFDSENVLELRFHSLDKMVGLKAAQNPINNAFFETYTAYTRRMQCTFGWDWVHRFVSMGIWKSCRIVAYDDAYLSDAFVYTKHIDNNQASLAVKVDVRKVNSSDVKLRTRLLNAAGKEVWNSFQSTKNDKITALPNISDETGEEPAGETVERTAVIDNPQLWWPNGMGKQPLYTLDCSLFDNANNLLSHKQYSVAIRTVELREKVDGKNSSSFTIHINGTPVFAKGGNWVPADPFPSRIPYDKYQRLIGQAAKSGANMLRVWGGGIYESDAFYHVCDSLGIMLWQDFMVACSNYPENDPAFVSSFTAEIMQNVKRIRNHPSMVIWSGGNELALSSKPQDNWCLKSFYAGTVSKMMAEIDPSRPFRLNSPYSKDENACNSRTSGEVHSSAQYAGELADTTAYVHYRDLISKYDNGRFLGECCNAGTPPKRSLLRFMNEDDLNKSEILEYHTKDNPWNVYGGLTQRGQLERLSKQLYGNTNGDNDRRLRQMEYIQYEFERLALESTRSRKPYCSGVLFWMYNDCWPASGWSVIDYWGERKSGWYAMSRACQPVIAATELNGNDLKWWVTSDSPQKTTVDLTIKIISTDGSFSKLLKKEKIIVPANDKVLTYQSTVSNVKQTLRNNQLIVAEISYEGKTDRSYWTPLVPKQVVYPSTSLKVKGFKPGKEGEITISSDKWGHVVTLTGAADFEDNYFELLPGESRKIKWSSVDGNSIDDIQVSAWNEKK
jgi:beta-mannosidase